MHRLPFRSTTGGRWTETVIDTVASGFDGTARRIERGYDSRGMAASVTQYDADGDVDWGGLRGGIRWGTSMGPTCTGM